MKKLFLLFATIGLIFTACEGGLGDEANGGTPSTPKIELAQQSIEVEFEPAEYEVAVTSPYSWEATTKNDWIVVESETGIAGNEVLIFSTKRNEEEKERKGTITLKNSDYNLIAELYVIQKAFEPKITIEPDNLTFAVEGGTQEITITANFEYKFSTQDNWLTIKKSQNGITITAPNNAEFENRSAEITFSNEKYAISKVVKVMQGASVPTITIDPECLTFVTEGGTQEIAITANFEYQFSTDADWLTIKKSKNGINITSTANCEFEERTANITILSEKYEVLKTISVTQKGISAESKNIIFYTSSDSKVVTPYKTDVFGANIVSNTYENGKGVVIFDGTVTSIGEQAFYYCSSLTSITIPNSVTVIRDYAFSYCTGLANVTIPDSVLAIRRWAFGNCNSLTSITIGNSVTSIGEDAFSYCSSLTSITIPDSVTSIGSSAFSGCSSLTSVTIPDSVTSIGSSTFQSCSSLTSVKIGNSVTSIGEWAFYNCTSLTSVTIPDSVSSIGNSAFYGCTGKLTVNCNIPNASNSSDGAFYDSKFTSVTIGDSVTSIGSSAFYKCKSLTSVTIGNSVTSIGREAFYYCTGLTSVQISDSSAWCKIDFGNKAANPVIYAQNLYLNGELVTDITIPSDITKIQNYTFYYCTSLTSVTIPDSITSIGDYAFTCCSSLTSITIPNSVTSIGEEAFTDCRLTSVYCKPTTPPAIYYYQSYNSHGSFPFNSGMKIYVPHNSYDAYMQYSYSDISNDRTAKTNWYAYESYIEPYDFENNEIVPEAPETPDTPETPVIPEGGNALEITTASVKAAFPDLTTNYYGSQDVTNYSTYLTWDYFAACRICLPPSSGNYATANCLQMQGNTDVARQGRIGNISATPKRITKIIVESYNASYAPNFNLALGTEQVVGTTVPANMIPASSMTTSSVVEGVVTKYVSTYEVTEGAYTYFAIYKNTTNAFYFSKIRVEYAE